MVACRYHQCYVNSRTLTSKSFECDEKDKILGSGFCILHDKHYLQNSYVNHKKEIEDKLLDKIKQSKDESVV